VAYKADEEGSRNGTMLRTAPFRRPLHRRGETRYLAYLAVLQYLRDSRTMQILRVIDIRYHPLKIWLLSLVLSTLTFRYLFWTEFLMAKNITRSAFLIRPIIIFRCLQRESYHRGSFRHAEERGLLAASGPPSFDRVKYQ